MVPALAVLLASSFLLSLPQCLILLTAFSEGNSANVGCFVSSVCCYVTLQISIPHCLEVNAFLISSRLICTSFLLIFLLGARIFVCCSSFDELHDCKTCRTSSWWAPGLQLDTGAFYLQAIEPRDTPWLTYQWHRCHKSLFRFNIHIFKKGRNPG